jgi:hypothetical protein
MVDTVSKELVVNGKFILLQYNKKGDIKIMNEIEKLIQELQEDSSELYHKDRTIEQQKDLLLSMFEETKKLEELLSKQIYNLIQYK